MQEEEDEMGLRVNSAPCSRHVLIFLFPATDEEDETSGEEREEDDLGTFCNNKIKIRMNKHHPQTLTLASPTPSPSSPFSLPPPLAHLLSSDNATSLPPDKTSPHLESVRRLSATETDLFSLPLRHVRRCRPEEQGE